MIKLLIADDNKDFCELIKKYIQTESDMEVVACICDGAQVVRYIQQYKPHVLLLDLIMPNQDGLEVLEELRSYCEHKPKILLISAFGQDHFVSKANQLGVDYYLMKPFKLSTLVRRIRQIVQSEPQMRLAKEQKEQQLYERVVWYFSQIGMPPHYKGHRYLVDVVLMVISDKTWMHGITKRLYPEVGKRYNTTSVQVERAIRHAIEVTWERGNLNELNRLFPYSVDAEKGKPTNSAFIAKMADIIDLET